MNALKAYKKHQAEIRQEEYEKAKAAEQEKISKMSDEEREKYFKEKEAHRKRMAELLSIPAMLNGTYSGGNK